MTGNSVGYQPLTAPAGVVAVLANLLRLFLRGLPVVWPALILLFFMGLFYAYMVATLQQDSYEHMGPPRADYLGVIGMQGVMGLQVWVYNLLLVQMEAVWKGERGSLSTHLCMRALKKFFPVVVGFVLLGIVSSILWAIILYPLPIAVLMSATTYLFLSIAVMFFFQVITMFFAPLIVLDGDRAVKSLLHSIRLVLGNLLRTIVVVLVLGVAGSMIFCTVLFLMLEMTTDISLWELLASSGEFMPSLFFGLGSLGTQLFWALEGVPLWVMLTVSVLNALILPLVCAFMIVQLNDMKLRKGEVRP